VADGGKARKIPKEGEGHGKGGTTSQKYKKLNGEKKHPAREEDELKRPWDRVGAPMRNQEGGGADKKEKETTAAEVKKGPYEVFVEKTT